ncbi:hypothetical protein KK083_19120 [Fulvivirgaceae bacterium PWU4]|uniref:RHS repeat protein n=1 Tax=Chryseosolibacter histidini TaxID=2782349 RepID=A0AAP2DRH2_9BACT|nr:hypothetical protein [Chryseosolibacter histidini]MBT1699014.1 hypothetical protein [Chryseosolibacter histidini]
MVALKKISGLDPPLKITYKPDSMIIRFYSDWARKRGLLNNDTLQSEDCSCEGYKSRQRTPPTAGRLAPVEGVNHINIGKPFAVLVYEVDAEGKITKGEDSLGSTYSKYFYNDENRLVSIESFDRNDHAPRGKWIYTYEQNGDISEISLLEPNGTAILRHYYTDGLLDSSTERGFKSKYKFVYY